MRFFAAMDQTFCVGSTGGEWITRMASPCNNQDEEDAVANATYCLDYLAKGQSAELPDLIYETEGFMGNSSRDLLNLGFRI